jgi:hypothetical protein
LFTVIFAFMFVRLGRVGDDRGILSGCFETFEGKDETSPWDGEGAEDEDGLDGRESALIKATEGAAAGSEETNYVLD